MSAATLEREGGDDRDPKVAEIKQLEEMFAHPDAFVPDVIGAAPGEWAPQLQIRRSVNGVPLGSLTLRRAHITHAQTPPIVRFDPYHN